MRRLISAICAILLTFSCTPHLSVHQINTRNIPIDIQTSQIDSAVQSIVRPFHDSIEHDMSKLVAVSATPLVKGKPESKLTNLIADILLGFGTDFCAQQNMDINPCVSYVNFGGLRSSLPKGKITVGHIFGLMPFENEIVLIKISGAAIRQMADRIAARGGEGIAGMKIGISDKKLVSLKIDEKELDMNAMYWLVTNDYIANGGDQMSMFLNPADRINTKMKFRDLLIQALNDRYIKDGILDVKLDGRIYNEQ